MRISNSKTKNFKYYVAVNIEDRTQSKPSVRTVKMSSTPAFEVLKKSIEYRVNSPLVRTKTNYLFNASRHSNETWELYPKEVI